MGETNTNRGKKTIGSLETAFDIVELVAESGEITPTELASELDYSRSTIHYYLTTLEKHRFLTRGEDGYRLGFRFLHYGNQAIRDHELTGVVGDEVEKLAQETGMRALFAVEQQGRSVTISRSSAEGPSNVGAHLGTEQYLHATAFGKALLAHLPDDTVDDIVEQHGLPDVHPGAVTDRETLMRDLDAIREQGFAYEKSGHGERSCSIAVPVVGNRETDTVGTIGIVGRREDIPDPSSHIKAQRFVEQPTTMVKRYAQILRNKIT